MINDVHAEPAKPIKMSFATNGSYGSYVSVLNGGFAYGSAEGNANLIMKGDNTAKLNGLTIEVINPLGNMTIKSSGNDCYNYSFDYGYYSGSQLYCNVDGITQSENDTSAGFGNFSVVEYNYRGIDYGYWNANISVPSDSGIKQIYAYGNTYDWFPYLHTIFYF